MLPYVAFPSGERQPGRRLIPGTVALCYRERPRSGCARACESRCECKNIVGTRIQRRGESTYTALPSLRILGVRIGSIPALVFLDPAQEKGEPYINIGNRVLEIPYRDI